MEAWLAASNSEDDEKETETEQQVEINKKLKDLINDSKRKREDWEKSKSLQMDVTAKALPPDGYSSSKE